MSLGLGKILGLGILGQFMGGLDGKEEEQQQPQGKGMWSPPNQQPTQVASSGQNNLFGMDMNNMSQSQWANLAIGLNSMRLRPNKSLAASMQATIDNATKKTNRNATVEALIKMGKPNLANLVQTGAMDVNTAMTLAFKEVKGDVNGTQAWMETFRGQGTPEQDSLIDSYRALIASAAGDPTAIREYVKLFSNDFGIGVKDLKDTVVGGIQIQQKDGVLNGITMKEGQKYTITIDEFGEETVHIIDGAFGETEEMKYERELKQQLNTDDRKLSVKNSNAAYLEASSAMDSVQKYQHVQSVLMNPDGTFNKKAITGWITDFLPSFTAEQAIIKSTANIMGIDVINMATFGALSEREMQMAMQTNLDTRLPPEELYKQIVSMVESRQKLASEMLKRAGRMSELGSWEAYKAEQIIERKGHIATRFKVMPPEVQQAIMVEKYKADTRDHPDITFETWDANNAMTGYQIWGYFNFYDRARFIANMDGMTGKEFLEIMGNTDFASDWWKTNEGTM
jgi:hypothetical protein